MKPGAAGAFASPVPGDPFSACSVFSSRRVPLRIRRAAHVDGAHEVPGAGSAGGAEGTNTASHHRVHHRRNSHYFSLITALIRNRKIRARGFFRAVFFFPVPLSPVVVAPIWKWILLRDGILNAIQGELDVQWHYILAIAVVTPLPVVLVFAFLQRFIATGTARTGMR